MAEKKPRRPTKKKIQKLIEKQGKVRAAFILRTEYSMEINDIANALNVGKRTVHSYIWRIREPEKYKALLARYFEKKRQKKEVEEMNEMARKTEEESK